MSTLANIAGMRACLDGLKNRVSAIEDGQREGTSTLVAGTVTIPDSRIQTTSNVYHSRHTTGGTVGNLSVTIIAGTSFTINSSSNTETSSIDWLVKY